MKKFTNLAIILFISLSYSELISQNTDDLAIESINNDCNQASLEIVISGGIAPYDYYIYKENELKPVSKTEDIDSRIFLFANLDKTLKYRIKVIDHWGNNVTSDITEVCK
jgi:hypothetical protein